MERVGQLFSLVAALVRRSLRLLAPTGPVRRRAAQGLVEYAIILVLVAVVVVGVVTTTGRRVSSTYDEINCTFARQNGEGPTNNGANRQCSTNPGSGNGNGNGN